MNNFPVKVDGREYWISRSVAVVALILTTDNKVLAVQRGEGTPDLKYIGSYCLPCGYVEYNETCSEAISREVEEETGLYFEPEIFELLWVDDNPEDDERQNINFIYRINSTESSEELEEFLTIEYSEKEEVASVRFIDIDNIGLYEWAFNHEELIKEVCSKD